MYWWMSPLQYELQQALEQCVQLAKAWVDEG